MDVASCLKAFESSFGSYMGDDPLDAWLKFVEYLDQSGSGETAMVLKRLVQNFLGVERYADDARFVNVCIRCATYFSEPIALFQHIFNKGVGTQTTALYVAWAQQFERQAMMEKADVVYLRALENRAQPVESLMREYRQFQARIRSRAEVSGGDPEPSPDSVPAAPTQVLGHHLNTVNAAAAAAELPSSGVCTVWSGPGREPEYADGEFVSMYSKDALAAQGSELCFEEVRTRAYWRKREAEEHLRPKRRAEGSPRSPPCPIAPPEAERSLAAASPSPADGTPKTSATGNPSAHQPLDSDFEESPAARQDPSRSPVWRAPGSAFRGSACHDAPNLPPSPTVNTREALDVIMGMFRDPTLTEELSGDTSDDVVGSAPPGNWAAAEPLIIYQDDVSAAASHATPGESKATRGRGLSEKAPAVEAHAEAAGRDQTAEGMSCWDEDRLAACPNNTADFALAARCVSTPFARRGIGDAGFVQVADVENSLAVQKNSLLQSQEADVTCAGSAADQNPFLRRCHKLSPIMEQSPPDVTSEGLAAHRPSTLSVTSPAVQMSQASVAAVELFTIPEDLPPVAPQELCKSTSAVIASPEKESCQPSPPGRRWKTQALMSTASARQGVAGPDGDLRDGARPPSDPWSAELISDLLSRMSPPLASHPQLVNWQRGLPDIGGKKTISMGTASLRVDRVLGQGAFATVYLATDPATSDKMVLKVQKPSNPWEFYIHTQLDRRLSPSVRHLFSRVRSAHIFTNGSVLVGELHAYGTLLNAANLYKSLGDRVMPQPLVIHFAICILRMLEELHAARIIHADVKPDNFMLGQRFAAADDDFEPDRPEPGLVLIDLGQSIDMDLFPPGAAFTASCLTSGFRCTEMLSGEPWNYQTDLFGAAGTIHVLLFGTYMQVVQNDGEWQTCAAFRRMPHSDMWLHLFRTLLNVPACRPALDTLADLRRRLSAVLQRDYCRKLASLKRRLLVLLLQSCQAASRA
ncbi:mitotic checkpoint serine/threonine-protein kinase BUB1 isoform X1 [Syngnathus acus]|uniref:mitotic checkpoint serine/threonine-protein kinase BUB1 isoform X1 n=2 Tax=Syngnathus acus TaxID=161584 RepID=UPI001885E1CE|nr:mitotic checkpoint serine/threonine-protein kinase BUB1 isoform X1 [Syngnathus acus]